MKEKFYYLHILYIICCILWMRLCKEHVGMNRSKKKGKNTLILAPQKKEVNFLPKPEIAGGKWTKTES